MADEKLKILYLMQILLDETDKEHVLSATDLASRMDHLYHITCNRKTVYTDVEKLRSFGLKIEQVKGSNSGYYVAEREFELPELKLLVDAVQSAKFITTKKSDELIKKLEKMTSHENARQLQRQVYIYNRAKTDNETVYANVDSIHTAIYMNRQISFKYCEWSVSKKLVRRKNGADYIVSPWSLTWDDENYYLVAYEESTDKIKHYRVDKMQDIRILEEARLGREKVDGFDLAVFAKKTFGMYGGQDTDVTLNCDNSLIGVVIDRFGKDVMIVPRKDGRFAAHVVVTVSSQFFGWVTGIGDKMYIEGPEPVREEYKEFMGRVLGNYE